MHSNSTNEYPNLTNAYMLLDFMVLIILRKMSANIKKIIHTHGRMEYVSFKGEKKRIYFLLYM